MFHTYEIVQNRAVFSWGRDETLWISVYSSLLMEGLEAMPQKTQSSSKYSLENKVATE